MPACFHVSILESGATWLRSISRSNAEGRRAAKPRTAPPVGDDGRVAGSGHRDMDMELDCCLVSGTTCGCGLLCFTPDVLLCVDLSANLATQSPESSSLHAASRPICRVVLCNHVACLNSALPSRWLAYRQHSVFLCSPARISSGQLSCCCFVSCLGNSVPPESKVNPPPEAPPSSRSRAWLLIAWPALARSDSTGTLAIDR